MLERPKKNFHWYLLLFLFSSVLIIWYGVFAEERAGLLKVYFLNVGQGDAIFIEAPNGNQILMDGGPNKSVLRELGKVMPFYDRSIDMIIATHPDFDHIGGIPAVLQNYSVGMFLESGAEAGTEVEKELKSLLKNKKTKEILAKRGMSVDLGGGAEIAILFPDRDSSGWETNTASVVAKLIYGETSFLLTGDSPEEVENYLADLDGKNLKADVLKVSHHGSKNSSSESFLGFASPSFAVISAGKDNKFGHPDKEVLDLLSRFEAEVFKTMDAGMVGFESDGEKIQPLGTRD